MKKMKTAKKMEGQHKGADDARVERTEHERWGRVEKHGNNAKIKRTFREEK